jgi:hypothetical protein
MPLFRPRSRRCPLTSRSGSTRTACFASAGLGGRDPWSQAGTTFAKRLHAPQRAVFTGTSTDRPDRCRPGRYAPDRSLMGSDRSPAMTIVLHSTVIGPRVRSKLRQLVPARGIADSQLDVHARSRRGMRKRPHRFGSDLILVRCAYPELGITATDEPQSSRPYLGRPLSANVS